MPSRHPQGVLGVHVVSTEVVTEQGAHLVGVIKCQALQLDQVAVLLDPARNRIALGAPCGATVEVSLSQMLMQLALQVRPVTH